MRLPFNEKEVREVSLAYKMREPGLVTLLDYLERQKVVLIDLIVDGSEDDRLMLIGAARFCKELIEGIKESPERVGAIEVTNQVEKAFKNKPLADI